MTFSALLWLASVPDHLDKGANTFHTCIYEEKSLKSFKDWYFPQLFLSFQSPTCCSFRLLSHHAGVSWALLASSWSLAAIVPPCCHGTDAKRTRQNGLYLRLKPSHQISQQLVALVKYTCKPVSYRTLGNHEWKYTNTFWFVMGS